MPQYLSEEQYEAGRPVDLEQRAPDWLPVYPDIEEWERLIGRLENGLYVIYPNLTKEETFHQFYDDYHRGLWLTYEVRVIGG